MSTSELSKAWANHNRSFEDSRFVYPVISRRAKGLSIGINCTPNGACSFDCVYCQAGAKNVLPSQPPSVDEIIFELKNILEIYSKTKFAEQFKNIEEKNRLLKDVAFSGDGEPTLYPHFEELCAALAELQKDNGIPKLILITNAAELQRKNVIAGLGHLCSSSGEIWGKLDAGTDEWLQFINRPAKKTGISAIEDNLKFAVSKFPLRIQTMLCEASGKAPGEQELEHYSEIVERIYNVNPQNLLSVQLYSIARQTADSSVKPLPREFLENAQKKVNEKNSNLTVEVF